jgi:hypothetical protein
MILSGIAVPFRALVVAAVGAAIGWAWYGGHRWAAFIAPLVVALVAYAVSALGVLRLPNDPVNAVRLMPWRIVVPAVVAAAAAGVAIIVTVELTLPDNTAAGTPTPTDLKEIVSALSTAITAFLSAAFIDWTGDSGDSRLADWIGTTFEDKYEGVFKKGSEGERLVFSAYVDGGWSRAGRHKRAEAIKTALVTDRALAVRTS